MVFSSMTFMAFFFPAVVLLYFLFSSPRWRNGVLIVFSLLFYAWGEPKRVLLMLLSIFVNYAAALAIDRASDKRVKGLILTGSLCLTLGILVYFKYFAFFANSVVGLFGAPPIAASRSLPIGISFYTFQIVTYTVDVCLGKTPVQKSLPRLTLYISFFPQLIAGPIVNYTYIASQLEHRQTSIETAYSGFRRFLAGLGKKVLLANVCGEILEELALTGEMSVLAAWLGAIAYTLQIYFDFSGYSDMAIGMGRIFGFTFLENFNYPYISTSVSEFWRRWHISLGSFFREYVYIPMGGNRVSRPRKIFNLAVVWALTGLWHGASWNFIAWGAYYGLLLIAEKQLFYAFQSKIPRFIRWLFTMILVIFGWVIFYHESLADGLSQISAMLGFGAGSLTDAASLYYLKHYLGALVIACIACLPWPHLISKAREKAACANSYWGEYAAAAAVTALLCVCVAFMVSGSYNPFLYFRF